MQNFFIKISQKIDNKSIYRHLFFSLATIITIFFLGYYFGTFDQASHIPFLKKNFDPSLYSNDIFFTLRSSHYSFFWLLFIPLYRFGILEISMFIIHILITYFTYWAIWKLTKTIFSNALTSFLSIIAFTFPHIGFAGFTIFEFSLLNRTFVFPFLLLSINYYLKKYYWLAYLILGLMYNLHAVSGNFVLAMYLFDSVLRIKKIGLKKFLISLLLFFLCASPVFIWKSTNSHLDFTINLRWYEIIKNGILYNVFNITSINPPIVFLTLSGIASIIIFFITKKYLLTTNRIILNNFVFGGLIVLLTQIITSYFIPITVIIQSQILRIGIFLLFFSYLFFCNFISRLTDDKKIDNLQFLLLFIGLILSVSPILLIIILFIYKLKKIIKPFILILIITSIIIFFISIKLNLWRPEIHIFPNRLSGYQIQAWVKNNTPKNAVFITPPHLWWFYNLEWRVISERSTIVTLSELLEAAFEPRYINYWQIRFNDLAPNALAKFKGNVFDNFIITKKAYYSLSNNEMIKIAKKYKASYLVVEKPYKYDFPILYEDQEFRLYKIN